MPVTLREFTVWLDKTIPPVYQESYDNSGIQVGDPDSVVRSVLLTLDVTEKVIAEAAANNCNLVVSHHPLIFNPLKKINGGSITERCVAAAIKADVAVYSTHTCFDAMAWGVSHILAVKTGLENIRVLSPAEGILFKIAVYVPESHREAVRNALFDAGAGNIGKYSCCSFSADGTGTFLPGEGTNPFAGKKETLWSGNEVKIETVVPSHLLESAVKAMKEAHPYEEVAYDVYRLENETGVSGTGAIGTLPAPVTGTTLLENLKKTFDVPFIRYSGEGDKEIRTVAVCGGSGAGFINAAFRAGADAFITGDIKYHAFTEAPASMLVADIGHYESEKYSLNILYDIIIKKFPKFALRFSETKTNPINYI